MADTFYNGDFYTQGSAYTPASNTEIVPRPNGILLDVDGTATVRYVADGAQHVIPLLGKRVHRIKCYSIDAIGTATAVHVFR